MKFIYITLVSLIIITGCETTNVSLVPYKKESSKYINNIAILYSSEVPEMYVNVRNDDQMIKTLLAGPAVFAQLLMQASYYSARQEDKILFNDMVFDLNIGDVLCKKLNTKFQLCSYFHIVPQETIEKNKVVWGLLDKKEKDLKDYQSIGAELGVDALLEVNVLSYGIKDPGLFMDPYAIMKTEVKMTTTSEGAVLWNDIIQVKKDMGMKSVDFIDSALTDAQILRDELEDVADIASEECLARLGFDTNYTYLLDKDYIEKTEHKMDITKKLEEINTLRYEGLITNTDYNEKKLDLIERAKMTKIIYSEEVQISAESEEGIQAMMVEEQTKAITKTTTTTKLPTLPRRD